MTADTVAARVAAMPDGDVIYPVLPQAVGSRCNHCWQPASDLATCEHPLDGDLRLLCIRCVHALRYGLPISPTEEQLAEMWEWLAHQHINHKAAIDAGKPRQSTGVTEAHIDRALTAHTSQWMPPQTRWLLFRDLTRHLIEHQDAANCDVNYDELDPEWRHPEVYANRCRGLVEDAVNKLIGRKA
jgi:hypothetical protein